ncbi:peptidase C14, caspase domain-containing protein [Suillus bovinus]|uniref:peptidase C14, caspase domain-containing protein n=1 Tax=Suillus bovinus TaxID=48563 RepID=UPI001B885CEC|nr:peptidase C14, caspase domain-containing protein [Suillus bovinus]KAG2154244.1 peptidase C14, caspase domain-containing protein [Suillus bovinus]
MSSSQGVSESRKGRKKALLIAVRYVKGIKIPLPRTHYDVQELKELLISQYGYAEDDIVVLVDNCKLDKSFWPSEVNIFKRIDWLVEDLGEHDRLVFYYSGHGGQTICHHDSEVDGYDEAIYEYKGGKIIDNVLKQHLVNPVLKVKGCQLFALFDCCHSETILDLKHSNCCSRSQSSVEPVVTSSQQSDVETSPLEKWLCFSKKYCISLPVSIPRLSNNVLAMSSRSVVGLANRAMLHLYNHVTRILKVFLSSTPLSANEINVPVASSRQPVSVNTVFASQPHWLTSPDRSAMSPISIYPNARCNGRCTMTAKEENQGRVVCLSACKDGEEAHDDNMTGATFTKFFISSLKKNSSISYRNLLDDLRSQVTNLEEMKLAEMLRRTFDRFLARRRPLEITSECDDLINRKGSTQEPRITSNCPFDWDKKVSI